MTGPTPEEMSQIDRIAAAQMGVPPQQPPPQQAAPPPPAQPAPPTPQEKAVQAAAPTGEEERQAAEAVMYELDMGEGQKRKLSPAQIKSTFERYAALNGKHASMKPILSLAEQLIERSGSSPEQVAGFMANAMRQMANQGNTQMGNGAQNSSQNSSQNSQQDPNAQAPDPLAAWESENAATLPPGYRDLHTNMQQMTQAMAKQQELLQAVLQASQGHAQQGQQAQAGAQATQANAMRQMVANNLDGAQAKLGLGDDAAEDFMAFALERGFTPEDFVDPQLTMTVMSDFKNVRQSPEMERLRAMAQRRAAYTGSLGASATNAPGAPPPQDDTLARLTDAALAGRR